MNVLEKVRNIMFGDTDDFEEDDYSQEDTGYAQAKKDRERERVVESSRITKPERKDTKVVSLQTNMQMEVVITVPESYEDSKDICDNIKQNKPVIVNLEKLEYPLAQRLMDFLSGGCYSLNGSIQRVSNNIFIIAPANVDLSGDIKEELKLKGIVLPWVNSHK